MFNRIKVKIAKTDKDAQKEGIHLLDPHEDEIDNAIANSYGYTIIWIHTIKTWPIMNANDTIA